MCLKFNWSYISKRKPFKCVSIRYLQVIVVTVSKPDKVRKINQSSWFKLKSGIERVCWYYRTLSHSTAFPKGLLENSHILLENRDLIKQKVVEYHVRISNRKYQRFLIFVGTIGSNFARKPFLTTSFKLILFGVRNNEVQSWVT